MPSLTQKSINFSFTNAMEGIHHDGNIIKTKSFLNLWNICAGIYRLLFSGLMAGIRIDSECEIKHSLQQILFNSTRISKIYEIFQEWKINKHSGNIPKLKCTDLKKIGNLKSRYFDVSEKIFFQRGC